MSYIKKTLNALSKENEKAQDYTVFLEDDFLIINGNSSFVYGLGERYNQVNQKGLITDNKVVEQFCNQSDKTYFPLPFFFLENGIGFYIDTKHVLELDFRTNIKIDISSLAIETEVYIFKGSYKEIISDFIDVTGRALKPPKWIFGPWISAHRWNSQKLIEEQMKYIDELELPVTSLVIEQWSDEATFYIFNGSKYNLKEIGHKYSVFDYKGNNYWPNPKKLIEILHDKGLKVLLWQAPIIKALEPHETDNSQHKLDVQYLLENDMLVKLDGRAYKIPKGNWFPDSYVPDFTNPKTVDWWFAKRKYLFDIGIDGFKTDGGEFIHNIETTFSSGETGKEMINDYSRLYLESYKKYLNEQQVLFSRAGYTGQQSNTILWAGDQKSTWSELKNNYNAGLTASLSGQHLWSFDIGGFAGDLPSVELYMRSMQLGVFTPIMQIHSEPIGGQFSLLDPNEVMNNERTPWNIAKYYNRYDILPHIQKLFWLRMNILPYIYSETLKAIENKGTLMKHLIIEYPQDNNVKLLSSQHMLGQLIVAPILNEDSSSIRVYLPKGKWTNIFTEKTYGGNKEYIFDANIYDLFVFINEGNGLAINSNNLYTKTTNNLENLNLHLWLYGSQGIYEYIDDQYDFKVKWENRAYILYGKYPIKLIIIFK